MKNYNKEKRILHLAIVATALIFLLQLGKIMDVQAVWHYDWLLEFLVNSFFIAILIFSIVRLWKKQFAPLLIQLGGIVFTLVFLYTTDQVTDTEKNFHIYKEGREEVIQLVLDEKIAKRHPQITDLGQFEIPWGYMDNLRPREFIGKVNSKEMYFFFFPIYTQGFLPGGPGVFEGFVYSSLNRPPTWQEFDAGGQLKHIEGHWYYLNSEQENFEKDCPTLCK